MFGIQDREMEYDSDDYESEIQKYVATPTTETSGEFKFEIESLRAKENCWLGAGILVRPKDDKVIFSYSKVLFLSLYLHKKGVYRIQ